MPSKEKNGNSSSAALESVETVGDAVPPKELPYTIHAFSPDAGTLADLQRLSPWRSALSLLAIWIGCAAIAQAYLWLSPPVYLYPLFLFLMAGRQGGLLQIIHEGTHGLLHPDRSVNNTITRWLASYPIGLEFSSYVAGHLNHHAYTSEDRDSPTDTEKYRICDIRDPRLWGLFLKDLLGITALQVFFRYKRGETNDSNGPPLKNPLALLRYAAAALLAQAAIFLVLFCGDPLLYAALWIAPLTIGHMTLMRIRGIAEHGLLVQKGVPLENRLDQGTFNTRSFLTPESRYRFPPLVWIEKLLIGSLNVHYHHEHHLLSTVPYYNLPRLHRLVAKHARRTNPDIYQKGYFSCLFFRHRSG